MREIVDLLGEAPAIADGLIQIMMKDADFAAVAPDELHKNVQEMLEAVLRSMSEPGPAAVDPPRDAIRRWAERGVPLDTVMRAARLGFSRLWELLAVRVADGRTDRLPELVDGGNRLWELMEVFCQVVAEVYQESLADSACQDRARRTALVDALFEGRLSDWLRLGGDPWMLGLPGHGPYMAVSAECPSFAARFELKQPCHTSAQ